MINPQLVWIKALFFVISICMAQVIAAQDYLPTLRDDGRWGMARNEGMGSWAHFSANLSCDSIVIDSLTYRILEIGGTDYHCEAEVGYVRENIAEKKVYYRSAIEGSPYYEEEVLLLDYSVSIGDSVWVPGWGVPIRVDSIYMKSFNDGQQYKYFELDNSVFSYYEGLGSIWWGILPECSQYVFMLNYNNFGGNCDDMVSTEEIDQSNSIVCYPNPVIDELTISNRSDGLSDDIEFKISDIIGKKYIEGVLENSKLTISLDQVPSGILILTLYQDGRLIGQKKIINH